MSNLPPTPLEIVWKGPGEVRRVTIDLEAELTAAGYADIGTYAVSLPAEEQDDEELEIVSGSITQDGFKGQVVLTGGTDGAKYVLQHKTTQGDGIILIRNQPVRIRPL